VDAAPRFQTEDLHVVTLSALPRLLRCALATLTFIGLASCGFESLDDAEYPPILTLGGTVTGLTAGESLTLLNNATNAIAISANGPFRFILPVIPGSPYSITVGTQPTGQTCTVSGGTGVIGSASLANTVVTCASSAFTLGGSLSGLNAGGLVLANGADTITVAAGSSSFQLPTAVAAGASYAVTVNTQPTGESCQVKNGSGTMPAHPVSGVMVSCTDQPFSLGGTISGLGTFSGLVLANGTDTLNVAPGATTFTMPAKVPYSSPYTVSVQSAPSGLTCSVVNGSGSMPATNLSNIAITCSDQAYTVGGTIQGLTATGLVLANGGDQLSVAANSSSFTMPTPVPYTSTYAVTVQTQPAGQVCSVSNGGGTMGTANITNVLISCAAQTYTLSGTISGLTKTGLILANGTSTLPVLANAATFTMPVSVASGAPYNITVPTNPAALNCTVANPSGTITNADVTNIAITCAPGTESVLYSFGSVANDGQYPDRGSTLIQASDGNFYGVTSYGGANLNAGAIVRVTPSGDEVVLYSFTGGADGAVPYGPLIQASDGNLYGMTSSGGAQGRGVVFKITLSGTETVLHSFAAGGTDGENPVGGLIQATDGNFYGMTPLGGTENSGVIFRIDSSGNETILWDFGGSPDGETPYGSLLQASDGNLYGVTSFGGTLGVGCIFRITTAGVEQVLYSFQDSADGAHPQGSLMQASDGKLYGTTASDGGNGYGVVFRIDPASAQESLVYTFILGQQNGDGYVGRARQQSRHTL
jgi:uncharacterized repeat protein (TIGR03803 family)